MKNIGPHRVFSILLSHGNKNKNKNNIWHVESSQHGSQVENRTVMKRIKQMKVRVKSIQRVDVLLCAPRVCLSLPFGGPALPTETEMRGLCKEAKITDLDFVRHARMARCSACACFTLSDARAQTRARTRTTEKDPRQPPPPPGRVIVAPRCRSFKLGRRRKVKSSFPNKYIL